MVCHLDWSFFFSFQLGLNKWVTCIFLLLLGGIIMNSFSLKGKYIAINNTIVGNHLL